MATVIATVSVVDCSKLTVMHDVFRTVKAYALSTATPSCTCSSHSATY
jgi:hypothetical protein